MDIFPSEHLPGVGMGNIVSVVGLGGLLGVAVTAGLLVAEGALGAVVWVAGVAAVLALSTPAFGDAPQLMIPVMLVVLTLGVAAAWWSGRRSGSGAPAVDAIPEQGRTGRVLALLGVLVAGAASGVIWSEWNEIPFAIADPEAYAACAIGIIAAAIGGHASHLFVRGSIRAGGSAVIVGTAVCVVAVVTAAVSLYVPFAGFPVLVFVLWFGVRLGRRAKEKYKGLRILA